MHFICPQIVDQAVASGVTTLIGGGTGPSEGTRATTCTPSPRALGEMLLALDSMPVNVLLLGKGNTMSREGLLEQVRAGAAGLKLHEDWGTTPAAIDACLAVADETGVQVAIHTDTLNEAGYVQSTLDAIAGRTIHAYHTEGAGGGHAPDIIEVASQPNVLPSSTNPTRPHTVNTVDEHLDMLMVCHHLNPRDPGGPGVRREPDPRDDDRGRGRAARPRRDLDDRLGLAGDGPRRRDDRADVADGARDEGAAAAGCAGDAGPTTRACGATSRSTRSARRSRTGSTREVGSVEVGKLADLVLWDPAFFAIRPRLVIKGGAIAWAPMGDANASIPTPQPVFSAPMFAGSRRLAARTSVTFVSPLAVADGTLERWASRRRSSRSATRARSARHDMPLNDALPEDRGRPRHVRRVDRRRGDRAGARSRAAPGPALLALLNVRVLPMLLADARFPAGSYAHSLGLEQAVADGLAGWRRGVHRRAAAARCRADEALSVAARRRGPQRRAGRAAVDAEVAARCPSPVLREIARRLGARCCARRRRCGLRSTIEDYRAASGTTPRPVALGVVAGATASLTKSSRRLPLRRRGHGRVGRLEAAAARSPEARRWVVVLRRGSEAARLVRGGSVRWSCSRRAAVGLELAAAAPCDRRERLFVS